MFDLYLCIFVPISASNYTNAQPILINDRSLDLVVSASVIKFFKNQNGGFFALMCRPKKFIIYFFYTLRRGFRTSFVLVDSLLNSERLWGEQGWGRRGDSNCS